MGVNFSFGPPRALSPSFVKLPMTLGGGFPLFGLVLDESAMVDGGEVDGRKWMGSRSEFNWRIGELTRLGG